MRHTKIAGVLNLTPDSFSDGGQHENAASIFSCMKLLLEDGADIIDIGAESTRPGATNLSPDEEWQRLAALPEIIKEIHAAGRLVSIDTRHAETAAKAISLGANWINDVTGFQSEAMIDVVKNTNARLVVMHSLGIPADPDRTLPSDTDPVAFIQEWALEKIKTLEKKGIARERIIIDPGIGFGKTAQQSLELLLRIEELKTMGLPLLIGHSRKSFLKLFTDKPAEERDDATLGFSAFLMDAGVDFLRVHNVSRHVTLRNFLPSQD